VVDGLQDHERNHHAVPIGILPVSGMNGNQNRICAIATLSGLVAWKKNRDPAGKDHEP